MDHECKKNSVVMYSNVITVQKDVADAWGEEKTKKYLGRVGET